MEPRPEALQKRELCPVPNRIASRVRTEAEIQPHDRAPSPDVSDADAIQLAVFEAQELLMRDTRGCGHVAKTQARANTREAMLLPYSSKRLAGSSATSISRTLSRSHDLNGRGSRFTGAHLGRWSASRTNGRTRSRIWPSRPGPTAPWSASRTTTRGGGTE
jgi:hypothetical protein